MPEDGFGTAVAVDGDVAAVGAEDSAYVFTRSGQVWTQRQRLEGGGFGVVEMDDGVVLVGAPSRPAGNLAEGAVHVYERVGSAWAEVAVLRAQAGGWDASFGLRIAAENGIVVVAAPRSTLDPAHHCHEPERRHDTGKITLTDALPAGTTFLSMTGRFVEPSSNAGPGPACSAPDIGQSGSVTCVGRLFDAASGQNTAAFRLVVRVDKGRDGPIMNTATATLANDPDVSNNTASVVVDVVRASELRPGNGCGDKNHVHAREDECKKNPG